MFENMNELLNSIQHEVGKKFENSKYIGKIKDIFENKFELIREYFLKWEKRLKSLKWQGFSILFLQILTLVDWTHSVSNLFKFNIMIESNKSRFVLFV